MSVPPVDVSSTIALNKNVVLSGTGFGDAVVFDVVGASTSPPNPSVSPGSMVYAVPSSYTVTVVGLFSSVATIFTSGRKVSVVPASSEEVSTLPSSALNCTSTGPACTVMSTEPHVTVSESPALSVYWASFEHVSAVAVALPPAASALMRTPLDGMLLSSTVTI